MYQPGSCNWQLNRTDRKVQLERRESYSPSDLTTHYETDNMRAGWPPAYLPYHTLGISPYTMLSAIFPDCFWKISKHSHGTHNWKEGDYYFKEDRVPCLCLCALKLTTHSVYHGSGILNVKERKRKQMMGSFFHIK